MAHRETLKKNPLDLYYEPRIKTKAKTKLKIVSCDGKKKEAKKNEVENYPNLLNHDKCASVHFQRLVSTGSVFWLKPKNYVDSRRMNGNENENRTRKMYEKE